MLVFYLISVLPLFVSCRQAVDFAESYDVTFSNRYFEPLVSIEIDNRKIENIDIGEDRTITNIGGGSYSIIVITYSNLKLEAVVGLAGSLSEVKIIITETGKLLME
ncbi:MAG: hypothetical protein LBP81_05430 [Treponema sp.]|jgi:hypothetical protein|nr:hypothetical protein [Treponema sp.]